MFDRISGSQREKSATSLVTLRSIRGWPRESTEPTVGDPKASKVGKHRTQSASSSTGSADFVERVQRIRVQRIPIFSSFLRNQRALRSFDLWRDQRRAGSAFANLYPFQAAGSSSQSYTPHGHPTLYSNARFGAPGGAGRWIRQDSNLLQTASDDLFHSTTSASVRCPLDQAGSAMRVLRNQPGTE